MLRIREIRYIHQGQAYGIGYQVVSPKDEVLFETIDREDAERYLMDYDHEAMNIILRHNVKELQEQLQESYKKLKELNDRLDKLKDRHLLR